MPGGRSPRAGPVFSPEERNRVREHVLALARSDPRVLSGAVLGSDAAGQADRWSDLDLTFGLEVGVPPTELLEAWSSELERTFRAVHLFDLAERATIYRVFLLPGNLQVDVSVTSGFAAQYGPKFRMLFGTAVRSEPSAPRSPREAFGRGAHHAVRGRYSLERGRTWQAEYWISGVRDEALSLACIHRGLDAHHGRGFDKLPASVLIAADAALVRSLEREEMLRALDRSVDLLLREAGAVGEIATRLGPQLRDLGRADWR